MASKRFKRVQKAPELPVEGGMVPERVGPRGMFRPEVREAKKAKAIEVYEATFGNITETCRCIGIGNRTFYDWLENDAEFKAAIEGIRIDEKFVDWCESQLQAKIRDGDTASIIFALKTKGKNRGWVEKQEIEHKSQGVVFNLVVGVPQGGEQILEAEAQEVKLVEDVYGSAGEAGEDA